MLMTSPPKRLASKVATLRPALRGVVRAGEPAMPSPMTISRSSAPWRSLGFDAIRDSIRTGSPLSAVAGARRRLRRAGGGRLGGGLNGAAAPRIAAGSLRILRASPTRWVTPSPSRNSRISIASPRPVPVASRYCAAVNMPFGLAFATSAAVAASAASVARG